LVKSELAKIQHGIRAARWVAGEDLHCTLTFLGNVDESALQGIRESLRAARARQVSLRVAGLGVFPPRGDPRVVWAGIEPKTALDHLKTEVDRKLAVANLDVEPRPFRPHVTLARFRTGSANQEAMASYLREHAQLATAPFDLKEFVLYESRAAPQQSRYRRLATFALDEILPTRAGAP